MIMTTSTIRNYGTDHEYIVEPVELAVLWRDITGRKTITESDLNNLKALARLFQSGLSITRDKYSLPK